MIRKSSKGFTLMEMILVAVLIASVGAAVFSAFNNGLKLWAKGVVLDHQGDTAIALEKISDDIRLIIPVGNILFSGTEMRMAFPAIVLTPADRKSSRSGEGIVDQIGAVEYRFDPAEGKIIRRQANYGQALKKQWGQDQVIASNIEEAVFRYYFYGDRNFVSLPRADGKIPAGIILQIRMKGQEADQRLNRFIPIPAGG